MKTINKDMESVSAKNQLNLFGYEKYFEFFVKLFEKKEMPNSILLSGLKGLGKSTFAYHIINYLLSRDEEKKYSIKNLAIDKDNSSYKLLNTNIHPNFFLIENKSLEKDIKIEQIRSLKKFLNKTTYSKDLKIIMIDNAEYLNLNASNALLKSIEEPYSNTFFFIIHNSACKILDTIKSRCTEFKLFFSISEKKKIFENLAKQYKNNVETNEIIESYYFDTPGNLIKYLLIFNKANINILENKLICIHFFIEKYKNEKNPEILSFLSLFVEKFYNELCLNNDKNLNNYFFNQSKILKQIDDMKKFNLDEKNIFIWVKEILENETK